ncbi:MAG: tetratricopeptide repeat protein [Okeania sp. SIO3H1]|nr:tetratricopeptide repeat protein [Okeania sp. SIO3H1]
MDILHQQLQTTERVAITSITGMGGIGKTELALKYARYHLQQKTYPAGVCWLEGRGVDVGIQIVNFAKSQLNLNPPENYDLQTQVDFCWRNWLQGDVLVIFDDVVDYQEISDFLPPREFRFKVLITTRQKYLGQFFHRLELEVLDEDAALELLVSFVGKTRIQGELEEAKALCAELGFLPLGLELVARYLERKPDLSLAKARQRLESKRLEHKSLEIYSQDMTAERGVAAAFELSWQELGEDERELGRLLSLFAPVAIPWSLVGGCLPEVDEEDLEDRRDNRLVNLSLLQRVGEGSYELHPLIREFFRGKLSESNSVEEVKQSFLGMIREFFRGKLSESDSVEEMKRGICRVMVAEAKEIPQTPVREKVLAVEPAIPHLEEVAENLTDWLTDDDLIWPFVGLGRFYEGQGFYESAQPWFEECLDVTKSRFGGTHPSIASSLNNLAGLYKSQGRYTEAEPMYKDALEMRKQLLGPAHPDIATSLNNLAYLYNSQGRYTEAEPMYKDALEMRKQLLGPAHPDIATSFNNLAGLYNSQGRYTKAEPMYKDALEMRKQLLGPAHPDIATSLNNLAYLYKSQGRYTEAEPLYLQALEMCKQLLGSTHPSIASSLNNLAGLYDSQGRYTKAEPMYKDALEMRKQLLGSAHPDIASSLNNLASLYHSQGRYTEAEPLFVQALEMCKQLLGSAHPDIASSLNNLASLYHSQGRYTEAEPLFVQALEMLKQLLGPAHPDIVASLNNLAGLYNSQGRYTEAEPLFVQALAILFSQLGEKHPNTQTVWQNYGKFLQRFLNENCQGELSDEMSLQIISQMES